ncbi:hypothetical protein C8J57DRAFT_1729999 [Mycena rebaudengoi]|nr:hypothetical protein C8J57DRAFT_1729999 [Mycena rebaudengoi]
MSVDVIEIQDSDSDDPGSAAIPAARSTASLGNPFAPPLSKVEIVDVSISLPSPPPAMVPDTKPEPKKKGKGKGKLQKPQQIAITRQEKVDHIIHSTSVPMTYDVPRTPTALLVDLSGSVELLRAPDGHIVPLDTFIRAQTPPHLASPHEHNHPCNQLTRPLRTIGSTPGNRTELKARAIDDDRWSKMTKVYKTAVERFQQRLTFGSLYCDTQTKEAFAQLFTELFDTIFQVTGERLKLAPFYPDAMCRVIIMDGEVPQAQGYAQFLATYNDPSISGISTCDPNELLSKNLKTCNPHFERHIDDLPKHIPIPVIARLKSIMGLETQIEMDAWHKFVAAQEVIEIQRWYAQKLAHPWILPCVNKFLSGISSDDWDLTPNHSNYMETAHAGRNAETGIQMQPLEAVLASQDRDNIKAQELVLIQRSGVMRKAWGSKANREKLAAQRQIWKSRKEDMKLDKHRTDLKEQVNGLRADIEDEKSLRRDWTLRRAEIDRELDALRKGDLAGVRMKGRRAGGHPEGDHSINDPSAATVNPDDTLDSNPHYSDLDLNAGPSGPDESTITEQVISADPVSSDPQDSYGNGGDIPCIFSPGVQQSAGGSNFIVSATEDQLAIHMNYATDIDWTDVNGLFDNSWDSDAFFASVNPSMLNFGFMNQGPRYDGTLPENETVTPAGGHADADAEVDDGLGYFEPLYAPPAPLYVNASDMDVQVQQVNHSAFNRLSPITSVLPLSR